MNVYFVDTSALAKRYLVEAGSDWVASWIAPSEGNIVIVSEIVVAEMRSLLARRVREGLDTEIAKAIKLAFSLHLRREYQVIAVSRAGLLSAGQLTEKYPLRTLDAIHLAAALQAQSTLERSIIFVSADKQQLHAAAAEDFQTDDPTTHS